MTFSTFLICLFGAFAIIAISVVVWYRKDPAGANHAVDQAEEVAGNAKDGAVGLWAKFKAWRAKRKG